MNENEKFNIFSLFKNEAIINYICSNKINVFFGSVGAIVIFINVVFWTAPSNFPTNSIYDLRSGQTLSILSDNFKAQNIIKSEFWFKSFVYLFSFGHATLIQGEYALNTKQNLIILAWRVSHGDLNIIPVRITIPEGLNSYEVANIFSNYFPSFDKEIFLDLVEKGNFEGYLFPDTYFILPGTSEFEIIQLMNINFSEKIKDVGDDIRKFSETESDVIKMASIIEEEARTEVSRKIIAGILWKRLSIGMALQVDSSFKYINGKTTATLSTDDLKIDSPYNSYTNRGLPPTPISNPGLGAIKAAISPIKTPYLYFLTDNNGDMHYAATFEEHIANKAKYLRN